MEETTIRYKSTPDNWIKEKDNIKPNTVREIDDLNDSRLPPIFNFPNGIKLYIEMINTETGEDFKRLVKDVTFYKNLVIISWYEELELNAIGDIE